MIFGKKGLLAVALLCTAFNIFAQDTLWNLTTYPGDIEDEISRTGNVNIGSSTDRGDLKVDGSVTFDMYGAGSDFLVNDYLGNVSLTVQGGTGEVDSYVKNKGLCNYFQLGTDCLIRTNSV